jgi:hypothetical protein
MIEGGQLCGTDDVRKRIQKLRWNVVDVNGIWEQL